MATVKDIYRHLDTLAPFATQMSYDNAGFLVGRGETAVHKVLIALDITEEVVREAVAGGWELILSHHPVIFHPARSITDQDPTGRILLTLAENRLAAICAHTNLDMAAGGVNDALARRLGLCELSLLHGEGVDRTGNPYGVGRIGIVSGYSDARSFASFVRDTLDAQGLRLEDAGSAVHKVAVGGGACGDMLEDAAIHGCDTFVTSDVKYNVFLDARAMGINLIDAGHFSTENVVCPVLKDWLEKGFPELTVRISTQHREVFSCI